MLKKIKLYFLLCLCLLSYNTIFAKNDEIVSKPISIQIDWFDYNANLKALLDEYNIVELLKNTLSPKLKENPKLKIDNVGDYKLSGKILDFSISDYTRDKNNNVIEKRYIMLLNIDILKSDSGRNIYTQPNVFIENIFSTEQNPDGRGKSDRETIRDFIEKITQKINEEINQILEKRSELFQEKKKIELTEAQRKLLESLGEQIAQPTEKKQPSTKVQTEINIRNEHIAITSGDLEAAGEDKKTQNKFETEEKITFKSLLNSGASLDGNLVIKTKSYEENKKVDLDKILLNYQNKNLKISAGNIFSQTIKTIFSNSLEGLIADYQTTDKKNVYTIIAGRDREGKDNQYYARNSFVLGYTRNFENKQKLLFSAALSQDDKNSISEDTAIIPVRNYHTGVYGLFKLFAPLLLEFEFTHSFYKPTTFEDTDTIEDNAAMLKLNYKQDKAQATFEFNRVGSDFYTLNGIATPDKENINFNYRNVYKIFNYNINTRYQFDDLKKRNNKRNYVFEHKAGCNFKPLEEFTEGLRYIELFLEVLKSEKYNKISNSSVDRDNDLSTINAKYRFFNKLFDNQYLFNISFEHEREIDNLLNEKIYMRILEFDNNFKTKIIEKFTIDLRLKTRYKTYIADKEKYLNGSIAFIYNTPTLNFNIGYYTDITNSNQPNQDSRKHRYMFNCEYSQKLEKYSRALTLNLEYNENKFEDITLNYNKLSINTGLKIIF